VKKRENTGCRIKNPELSKPNRQEIKEKPLEIKRFQVVHLAAGEGFEHFFGRKTEDF